VAERVFFYGTLRRGLARYDRSRFAPKLVFEGFGWIAAALFDLGPYPGAIPSPDRRVRGELHRMTDTAGVLQALDGIEDVRADSPADSLYVRRLVPVTADSGRVVDAWVYFYNAPLGGAPRIASGDYVEYLSRLPRARQRARRPS
jgi:gamma-glutamylcyclotransferase (GGCT)/AIG2-like uncharacterized protein YtfP